MIDWQRAEDLLGETVREMGLLIVVFAPLDAIYADTPMNHLLLATMLFFGLLLVGIGILIEARK
jgi:hypothetical protein